MKKIKCCFDVTNEYINKFIPCAIDIEDNCSKISYEYINNGIVDDLNFNNFNVCSGYLKDGDATISNATITFLKSSQNKNTEKVTDGVNGIINAERNHTFEMHSNNIIVDKCKTDSNGKFTAFIENGVYDIKIDCPSYKGTQKSQIITDGIQGEFYYIAKSLINKRLGKSTCILNLTNARYINLFLLNEYKHYTNGDLIITQNNEVKVYKKINKNATFMLETGIYDIRIRNDDVNIKIINNFNFTEDDDFVEKLINEFLMNDVLDLKEA